MIVGITAIIALHIILKLKFFIVCIIKFRKMNVKVSAVPKCMRASFISFLNMSFKCIDELMGKASKIP